MDARIHILTKLRLPERVPTEDQESASIISHQLISLCGFVDDLAAAISLFQTLRTQMSVTADSALKSKLESWKYVAARDGTITIHNFAECLQGIKEQLRVNSRLNCLVDWGKIRAVTKDFKVKFPSSEKLRHGVAHAGQLTKSSSMIEENAIRGNYIGHGLGIQGGGKAMIVSCLSNETYATTHTGHIRSYDLTPATVQALSEIRDRFVGCFKQLSSDQE